MRLAFPFLLLLILLQACNSSDGKFSGIADGIPVVKLPMQLGMWSNNIPRTSDPNTVQWIRHFADSTQRYIWGRVFVDQPNIYLLASQPDDQGTVFLITFDRSGKLLSQEALQRGEYVSADQQYATNNHATLYADMRLYEVDSLFKYPYDSVKNDRTEGDVMCKVTQQEHTIQPDGSLKVIRNNSTGFFKIKKMR
ncbi:MAG: hypothetical protein WDO14_09340 [Bacteroidota bacterium]